VRNTRKQLVGKQQENNECRERERELRALERNLHLAWCLQVGELHNRGDR
jgi:hypothetical protein